MGMSSGGSTGYNSEINVTPMVDVMLVLLIIFMVITPLLQSGVQLTLPKNLNPDLDPDIIKDSAIVISVPDAGTYYFKKELYTGPAAKERLKRNKNRVILWPSIFVAAFRFLIRK
jgi:biopolymer transport protein TolR